MCVHICSLYVCVYVLYVLYMCVVGFVFSLVHRAVSVSICVLLCVHVRLVVYDFVVVGLVLFCSS